MTDNTTKSKDEAKIKGWGYNVSGGNLCNVYLLGRSNETRNCLLVMIIWTYVALLQNKGICLTFIKARSHQIQTYQTTWIPLPSCVSLKRKLMS